MKRVFSIVVPVYQNEANLDDSMLALLSLQQHLPSYDLELVFVEDGSRDDSFHVLKDYAHKYPGVIKVVKLTRNFGQTAATQAGLRHASGQCVGIISADLQEPPGMFLEMIKAWETGAKFVIGERCLREESQGHQAVSGIYWTLVRRYAFPDFPSIGYDFCLLDRQVVEDINRINEKNSSIFVLIYWLGYRPVRIPVIRRLRGKGRSQWKLWKKISFTVDTLIGFTYVPARLITLMGFTAAVLCLAYLASALAIWFWARTAPPGWMTVVGLTSLLGAMILFSLGIVSEYLVRILDEARKRPPFVVEQIVVHRKPES